MKYSIQLILLIGIGLHAIAVDRASCGAFDSIKDLVTGGGGESENENNLTPEEIVRKQDEESLYQGGVKEQVAHSALDVVLGRATDYIEENKVPSIMKPAVSLLAHGLKDKIHHKINSWDDQEQIEKLERERAENGEGELGEQREEQEGGEYENHGENENNEEEHKEGWFEKIKDKITGNDEEHKRRKRSLDNYNEQPLNAHQSKFSKLITTAKNLLHLNRKRQPAMQPRAYDQQQQQQQVQQRRKRDVSKSSEEGKPDGAFDRTKSVLSKLSPSNLMGKLNQHLGNDNQSKQ